MSSLRETMVRPAGARNRNVIIAAVISIVVIAMTLVILSHIGSANATTTPNGAERTAQAFYTAIKQQDYATAWAYLALDQQKDLTQYSFTLVAQQQDAKFGPVIAFKELRYDRDTNAANQAAVQEQVTRKDNTTYTIQLGLVQGADGSWKVLSENRPI